MAKHRRKAATHRRKRKAVTHKRKRKSIGTVRRRKTPKTRIGHKHHHWGTVSAHQRRVNAVNGHRKRRKRRGIGGVRSGSLQKMIIPAAVGFLAGKFLFK
jgi:hypothetical protein